MLQPDTVPAVLTVRASTADEVSTITKTRGNPIFARGTALPAQVSLALGVGATPPNTATPQSKTLPDSVTLVTTAPFRAGAPGFVPASIGGAVSNPSTTPLPGLAQSLGLLIVVVDSFALDANGAHSRTLPPP